MLCHDDQAIIAHCTPVGVGALALLRISGSNAIEIATKISSLPGDKKLDQQQSHTIHYGKVVDTHGNTIDTVLFLLMHAPRTFTGQDTIEISCHNNLFVIEAIIQTAIQAGARMAQQGEFAQRAVLHNKIDVLQAEAINELIHANNPYALKQSLAQLSGSLSEKIQNIEKSILEALAYTNASFEFIDEENLEFGTTIHSIVDSVQATINQLLQSFDQQKQIRDGVRIALIGSVNAGKSSLFNALAGDNRAIVTCQPGTTRDIIETGFYYNGSYWTIADTAGLRQTEDTIEKEGIERSLKQAVTADIILLISDSSRPITSDEKKIYDTLYHTHRHKIVAIHHKTDLEEKTAPLFVDTITSSVTQPSTIDTIKKAIQHKIDTLFASLQSPYLLNQRHYNRLLALQQTLALVLPLLAQDTIAYELIAYHLNDALAECAEISGKSASNQAMDAIFRQFCIGK